jgi:uncharacterized membrane protein
MRKSLAVTISLSCIFIAWIVLAASPIAYPVEKHDFTLTTNGQAYDRSHGFAVRIVSLSTIGQASGKLSKVLNLVVKSGDINVGHYGTFAVIRGTGVLIQSCHFIHLIIKITPKYGGRIIVWDLRGWTGRISGNSVPVLFYSSKVLLPLSGYPKLYVLALTGTLNYPSLD